MRSLLRRIRSWFSGRRPPEDPFAGVRVPVKRGPGGRSASAVIEEP